LHIERNQQGSCAKGNSIGVPLIKTDKKAADAEFIQPTDNKLAGHPVSVRSFVPFQRETPAVIPAISI
jgi:hypothetical protein